MLSRQLHLSVGRPQATILTPSSYTLRKSLSRHAIEEMSANSRMPSQPRFNWGSTEKQSPDCRLQTPVRAKKTSRRQRLAIGVRHTPEGRPDSIGPDVQEAPRIGDVHGPRRQRPLLTTQDRRSVRLSPSSA